MFIFTILCGASKGFMKTLKAFIKLSEAPERSVKIKISVNFFFLSGIRTLKVKASIKNLKKIVILSKQGKYVIKIVL